MKNKKKAILDGYRVIDASRILVGSISSLMLAEMGAEVIKIEQREKGDDTRHWGPPFILSKDDPTIKDSTYYMCLNRNKQSITLDMKKQEGKEILNDLAKNSDIFI